MKTKLFSILFVLAGLLCSPLCASEVQAGPRGGRLLPAPPLQAEILVDAARSLEVVFYDAALKPVSPAGQQVSVVAEAPSGRSKVALLATPTGYRSDGALPEGVPYRIVVQIRASAEARPANHRIDLNLAQCGGCQRAEYACTCESH